MSTRMSSDLSHNHTRTSSFSNLFAYTAASGSHFSCTLGMCDTRNHNLALFLGFNLSRLLLTRMSSILLHNHSRTSSFSNWLAYTAASGSHFSCTLGMGDTWNDNFALFLGFNMSQLLLNWMSSELLHNHSNTSAFSNLLAYTAASGSHFFCTLYMDDTRNDNLALFLGFNLSRLLLTRMSLTCRKVTVGQAHFLTYLHIQPPLATIFLALWTWEKLKVTTLYFS